MHKEYKKRKCLHNIDNSLKFINKIKYNYNMNSKKNHKHNFWTWVTYDIKKYGKFSNKELKEILYSTLAAAFVVTFNKWGTTHFDLERGLANFFIHILFIGIFFMGQLFVKKIYAVKLGYEIEYEWSMVGIMVMLTVAFIFYVHIPTTEFVIYLPILLMGHSIIKHNERRRLGGWRYTLKYIDHFKIYGLGYLFNYLIILLILGPIYLATQSHFVMQLIQINLALMFYPMLPLPKNDGLILFFGSRNIYFTMLAFIIIVGLLILVFKVFAFILAAILGLIFARIIVVLAHK